jgi:hypothetical protein
MVRIEAVRSEKLSEKHNGNVFLIYWHDASGPKRIGIKIQHAGRTGFQWTKDSSLYLRLEQALEGESNHFEELMKRPLARFCHDGPAEGKNSAQKAQSFGLLRHAG